MGKGKFISVESIDGGGKTTQIPFIADYLRKAGYDVLVTREPGGTPIGEKLRSILLNEEMSPMTELLLFNVIRQELADKVIKPALAEGKVVLCDRYIDSTYAYQGHGRGLYSELSELHDIVAGGLTPNYTLFLSIPLEESIKRLKTRAEAANKFDNIDIAFKEKVYDGYMNQVRKHPDRIHVINALGSIDEVSSRICDWLDEVFIKNEHP